MSVLLAAIVAVYFFGVVVGKTIYKMRQRREDPTLTWLWPFGLMILFALGADFIVSGAASVVVFVVGKVVDFASPSREPDKPKQMNPRPYVSCSGGRSYREPPHCAKCGEERYSKQ